MAAPIVGQKYRLRHSKLGTATVLVTAINGEWIDTLILAGELVGMMDSWGKGENKTVLDSHSIFYPLKDAK